MFVLIAFGVFNAANFDPFMPMGFSKQSVPARTGHGRGRRHGGRGDHLLRFLRLRCDRHRAEEAKNPDRDLAIGIVGSMILCVIIYMAVAAAAIGAFATHGVRRQPRAAGADPARHRPPDRRRNCWRCRRRSRCRRSSSPSSSGKAASFFAMARDGLLPESLAHVSKRGTPARITIFTATRRVRDRGAVPAVRNRRACQCRDPDRLHRGVRGDAGHAAPARRTQPRKFRAPAAMVRRDVRDSRLHLSVLFSLPTKTQEYFLIWNVFGIVVYWFYGSPQAPRRGPAR